MADDIRRDVLRLRRALLAWARRRQRLAHIVASFCRALEDFARGRRDATARILLRLRLESFETALARASRQGAGHGQ